MTTKLILRHLAKKLVKYKENNKKRNLFYIFSKDAVHFHATLYTVTSAHILEINAMVMCEDWSKTVIMCVKMAATQINCSGHQLRSCKQLLTSFHVIKLNKLRIPDYFWNI